MAEPTYYEILGVSPDATDEELKKAFRKARAKNHPDARGDDADWAFLMVETAYETLKDSASRAAYDASLNGGSTPTPPPASTASTEPQETPSQEQTTTQAPTSSPTSSGASQAPSETPQTSYKSRSTSAAGAMANERMFSQPTAAGKREAITQLDDGWSFSPPEKREFNTWITLLAALTIFVVVAFFITSAPLLVLIANLVGIALIAGSAFMERNHQRQERMVGLVMLGGLVLATLPGVFAGMISHHGKTQNSDMFFMAVSLLLGLGTLFFGYQLQKERTINKLVPVANVKQGRVFGEPKSSDPNALAVLMNIRMRLTEIVHKRVDGAYLLSMNSVENPVFGNSFVVTRGQEVFFVYCEAQNPGAVTLDQSGMAQINGVYVPSNSQAALDFCSALSKAYKNKRIRLVYTAVGAEGVTFSGQQNERYITGGLAENIEYMTDELLQADKTVDRIFMRDALNGFRNVR